MLSPEAATLLYFLRTRPVSEANVVEKGDSIIFPVSIDFREHALIRRRMYKDRVITGKGIVFRRHSHSGKW